MTLKAPSPAFKAAARITQMLDHVDGADRFDSKPVDVADLALQFSEQTSPDSPILEVSEKDIPGCMGALVYGESKPRQWAILYHHDQSPGRKAYTIAHEFGHYVMHRKMIDEDDRFDGGVFCDEDSVLRRNGSGIELEADQFAANLLMPLHDFRKQIPAKKVPSFDDLGTVADRYGVSLTAATLRWLEYTETRALLVVSNEGFADWAKSSTAAFKSGNYIKTRGIVYELPPRAVAVTKDFRAETVDGICQDAGIWFPEPVLEMCIRSERYDQEMTLLHLRGREPVFQAEEAESDLLDRISYVSTNGPQ